MKRTDTIEGRTAHVRLGWWRVLPSLFVLAAMVVFASLGGPRAQAAELIMLEQDNCYWCEQWNEDIGGIYHKTKEGQRAPLKRLNIHDRLPPQYAFVKKGSFTPTFVLVEAGREIGRIRGYPGPDFFWPLLGELLAKLPSKKKTNG